MTYINTVIACFCFMGAFNQMATLTWPIGLAYCGFGLGYVGLAIFYGTQP